MHRVIEDTHARLVAAFNDWPYHDPSDMFTMDDYKRKLEELFYNPVLLLLGLSWVMWPRCLSFMRRLSPRRGAGQPRPSGEGRHQGAWGPMPS